MRLHSQSPGPRVCVSTQCQYVKQFTVKLLRNAPAFISTFDKYPWRLLETRRLFAHMTNRGLPSILQQLLLQLQEKQQLPTTTTTITNTAFIGDLTFIRIF